MGLQHPMQGLIADPALQLPDRAHRSALRNGRPARIRCRLWSFLRETAHGNSPRGSRPPKSGNTLLARDDNAASASLPKPDAMLEISTLGATSGFNDRGQSQNGDLAKARS
jgi:hypothetical protein